MRAKDKVRDGQEKPSCVLVCLGVSMKLHYVMLVLLVNFGVPYVKEGVSRIIK